MKKRLIALALCATLMVSVMSGCSKTEDKNTDTTNQVTSQPTVTGTTDKEDTTTGETTETTEPVDFKDTGLSSIFPLKEKVTLTYYIKANSAMSATMETYEDVEYFKKLEELTNVHIEWNHNTSDESFALMLASGKLPDLINWPLGNAAGGVVSLLEDEVILDLTEYLPEYAPNYYSWMQANPEEDKAYKLDDGTYYQFINFNGDLENQDILYFKILGPQIRQDWLDQLGMSMPTTTDELYDVLVAFKNNDMNGNGDTTDEIPYAIVGGDKGLAETMYTLAGSFGTTGDFNLSNGEIVFGPTTDNYKQFLQYMKKLYDEGLINSDFAVNGDALNFILQDKAGFTIGSMGSALIASHELLKTTNPDYNYVSVPWLIGPDGYQSGSGSDFNTNPRATAVTTACENPEIAIAWLDYAYSYAGSVNSTFGIEGESYEYVDGYPTVIDAVKQNNNGWSEEQSMARWMLGSINYPNARDFRFYEQINLNEDYKVDIQNNWSLAKSDLALPPIVMTTDETTTYSNIMADIKTYVSEVSLKFILGQMDLDTEWDTYVANVQSMNIDDAKACKQAAYDRYQNR